jgi:UrcA family protein
MSSKYLLAISASFVLLSTGAAVAADAANTDNVSKRVSYADLNLASEEGVATLNARIRWAARSICDTRQSGILREVLAERACMREAMAGVSPKVELAVARFERQQYARTKFIELASRP